MRKSLVLILCVIIAFSSFAQNKNRELDEVISLRLNSKKSNLSLEERLRLGIESVRLAEKINIDSTILLSRRQLSLLYYSSEKYDEYLEINKSNIELAQKINDSTSIAIANDNLAIYFHSNQEHDSAYYYYINALKYYNLDEELKRKAIILLNIADIQDTEKDYIGSEENAIKALRIFENLPSTEDNLDNLWILNNLLGIISLKLDNYEKSLEYHNLAIEVASEMSKGFYNEIYSLNNKAFVYRKLENYDKALQLYSYLASIKEQYHEYDPTFYPLVIDNLAFTKFLAGDDDIDNMESLFKEAYHISDSLDDNITKLAVSIDLSKFYFHTKKDSSLKYANKAYKIAKEISSNEILLETLRILSKLKDGQEGKTYLYEHIKLSDSLLKVERNVHNKFARIEFDTDKIEEENERISQQKMWLMIVSAVLLVTLFLLYIIITQRAKNKELQFEKDQQKANEEIYNLMLSQQDKVDEARANEKKRISQEMHDGILGRLFGTRLSLDSLNFSEGKEAIQNRSNYINELKTIEDDIRKISHDLNTDFVSGSGFMDIVSELIEKQTTAYQLKYNFDFTDDVSWESVSNKNKINIYRIIQESLQNIYKHANAELVRISFELKNNVILLSITDDGKGFDVNKSKKGIGIKNINARVNDLQGTVDISSQLNKGTTIHIEIPYKTNP